MYVCISQSIDIPEKSHYLSNGYLVVGKLDCSIFSCVILQMAQLETELFFGFYNSNVYNYFIVWKTKLGTDLYSYLQR